MSEFREALRRAVDSPAVESTPKPRAGEHTFTDVAVAHAKELDALRERERELVEALETILRAEFGQAISLPAGCESTYWGKARALLAKHGR